MRYNSVVWVQYLKCMKFDSVGDHNRKIGHRYGSLGYLYHIFLFLMLYFLNFGFYKSRRFPGSWLDWGYGVIEKCRA